MKKTFYTVDSERKITAWADWKFAENALVTEREIVRGYDGQGYFAGDEPEPPQPTQKEIAEQRIEQIKARLVANNLEALRPFLAERGGYATAVDEEKLQTLAAEAKALREEMAGLVELLEEAEEETTEEETAESPA